MCLVVYTAEMFNFSYSLLVLRVGRLSSMRLRRRRRRDRISDERTRKSKRDERDQRVRIDVQPKCACFLFLLNRPRPAAASSSSSSSSSAPNGDADANAAAAAAATDQWRVDAMMALAQVRLENPMKRTNGELTDPHSTRFFFFSFVFLLLFFESFSV